MIKRFRAIDFSLWAPLVGILILLWLALYSATSFGKGGEAFRQLFHIGLGLLLLVGFTLIDYHHWRRLTLFITVTTLLSLLAVLVVGHSVNGAQRWISLGGLGTFQPSELAKFATILLLADRLSKRPNTLHFVISAGITAALFFLVLIQPDLGTALVIALLATIMAYASGLSGTLLFALTGLGASALPFVLKDYQRDRLLVFINPEIDPMGMGYQLVQSQTAIGSGRFWGAGLFHGHMTQHGFVPENWTDFLFSVVGEEFGFLGGLGLLLCYGILFFLILSTASQALDRFGALLCLGFGSLLMIHAVINIAMTVDLAPVVGIPLPLGSFGGTAMLINMAGLGIVSSVRLQSRLPQNPLSDRLDPCHPSPKTPSQVEQLTLG